MSAENRSTGAVRLEQSHDPREVLVRNKYFSLRPKPLERWLWQRGLPQAAERIFWLHWEEGMRSGDWCSQIPLKRVASLCCVDSSTVTRAYQLLKSLGLIQRQDPGRDPGNPFQQATAVTEVRVPRELLVELSRSPDRPQSGRPPQKPAKAGGSEWGGSAPTAAVAPATAPDMAPAPATTPLRCPTRPELQALWGRASVEEKARYFQASRRGVRTLELDPDTRLTAEDRRQLASQLEHMARALTAATPAPPPRAMAHPAALYAQPRKLSALELARTRRRISEVVAGREVAEVLRQVAWAVEEGALRRFEVPLAVNIALKKIREGGWTRPNRMPPNWWPARPEPCSAA